MMVTQKIISNILKPLVISGVYKDETVALKDIIADYIHRRIDAYISVIKKMESKYGKDFDAISKKIQKKATIEVEDDWMEWKAAIVMSRSWHQALKKLLNNAT
jgi:hypothetical protein